MRTGKSGSLRDQPRELTESRNELFAMFQFRALNLEQADGDVVWRAEGVHGRVCRQARGPRGERPKMVCRDYARWSADDPRRVMY